MGRNRKKSYQQLPKRVYVNRGRYVFIDRIDGVQQKAVIIGKTDISTSEVWKRYEKITGDSKLTLKFIVDKYINSLEFSRLKSKEAMKAALNRLLDVELNTGSFGQIEYKNITTGLIQKYIDKRNCVAGNREITYLSSAWAHCYRRDIILKPNPCKGVKKIDEAPRKRYVTDEEYQHAYDLAPRYLQISMELAYMCRLRKSEVLDIRVSDIEPDGLNTRRLKGSNNALTLWSDRLTTVIDRGLKGCLRVPDMPVVNNGKGGKITVTAFNSAWRRLKQKMKCEPFNFHDLKSKGVSDFTGDKKAASGHKTEAMVNIYDRKRKEVKPT